jgi:hypothetical protein
MTTLTFTILYHRTLNNKSTDRVFIEVKEILRDKRFSIETKFNYENVKEGIVTTIEFVSSEEQELYMELLGAKDLYLGNTLMSKY